MKKIEKSIELGGRKLTLQTGVLANQATSSVLATYGETVVLATIVSAPLKADLGYFPLSVDYQEKLYAGGRIKGSKWVKREGRPTDEEILNGRLIDRSIRPLFPKNYKKEVQVIVMVLSVDMENDPGILGAIAVSAGLSASRIPWKGPVSVLRVGRKDGEFLLNPQNGNLAASDLDVVVSNTDRAVVMLETAAREVPETEVAKAIEYAQAESKIVLDLINDFATEVGAVKEDEGTDPVTSELKNKVKKLVEKDLDKIVKDWVTHEGFTALDEVKKFLFENLAEEKPDLVSAAFEKILKAKVREIILSGKRPDGRKLDEVRPLSAMVGILPRTHGTGLFQRGQTQVLSVATLGGSSLEQLIETAEGEESKRYMHHYSMPPYATGEAGRVGSPNRREIGHGALAEKALMPVIPSEEVFPYAIRVVSEVLGSNGSSSMASTCGSTLALMDAGVPITSPVSGIAMGVIMEGDKYQILTDIIGVEDFMGDMDFKVTGTAKGVTAIQLDVKTLDLTSAILAEALTRAKEARMKILDVMLEAIPEPRKTVSAHAPKIKSVKIPLEKIGEVIGPGGRTIKGLIAQTGTQIEVEDDGTVSVSGLNEEAVDRAVEIIQQMTKEILAGEVYEGEVKRIESFGAFIEILPGRDGMVHVSDMSTEFVNDAHYKVAIGDKVQVRVKEIDNLGRINLSMLLDPSADAEKKERRSSGEGGGSGYSGNGGGGYSGGRPSYNRGGSRGGFSAKGGPASGWRRGGFRPSYGGSGGANSNSSSGGPHFPASRLMD